MHIPKEKLPIPNLNEYGGLEIEFDPETLEREIDEAEEEEWFWESNFRNPTAPLDDDFEPDFVPYEDDYLRLYKEYPDDTDDDKISHKIRYHPMRHGTIGCRRVATHALHFLNCNNFHELTLVESGFKVLGYVTNNERKKGH
jgi:hypothetical protein